MTKESFKDTLQKKYVEDIREAYRKCAYRGGSIVDYTKLWKLIGSLQQLATKDGLSAGEFEDLAKGAIPGVFEKTDFSQFTGEIELPRKAVA